MKKVFLLTLAFTILGTAPAFAGSRLRGDPNSTMAMVTEAIDLGGTPVVTVKTGSIVFDNRQINGYGFGPDAETVTNANKLVGEIAPFQPQNVYVRPWSWRRRWLIYLTSSNYSVSEACAGQYLPPTETQVIQQGNSYLTSNYGQVLTPLTAYMKKYGIPKAVFRLQETVNVATNLDAAVVYQGYDPNTGDPILSCNPSLIPMAKRTLVWNFVTDQDGHITFPDASTKADAGVGLIATYFSKALRPEVPANYAYSNGGQLSYQAISMQTQQTIASSETVDTQGAYDAADSSDTSIAAAVNCMADNTQSGCTQQGLPDLDSLMDKAGASMAILNFVDSVTPDYVTVQETTSGGTAQAVQDINWQIWETGRTLTFPQCGYAVYENKGQYQMVLDTTVEQFTVQRGQTPQLLNKQTSQQTTPQQNFDMSTKVGPDKWNNTDSYIIDPTDGQTLLDLASVPGVQPPVAPLQTVGTPLPNMQFVFYPNGSPAVCDVPNTAIVTPQCPTGYTTVYDATGGFSCTATPTKGVCPDGSTTTANTCTVPANMVSTPWQ